MREAARRLRRWSAGVLRAPSQTLLADMRLCASRFAGDAAAPPEAMGSFEYFSETTASGGQRVCRRPLQLRGRDAVQVLYDTDELLRRFAHVNVRALAVSPDEARLAVAVDMAGSELCELHVWDIASGARIEENAVGPVASVAWGATSDVLFYTSVDARLLRPHTVMRRTLGTPNAADRRVHSVAAADSFVGITRSRDARLLLISANSKTTSEIHGVLLEEGTSSSSEARCIVPALRGRQAFADAANGQLFVLVNRTPPHAPTEKLAIVVAESDMLRRGQAPLEHAQLLYAPSDGAHIEDMYLFSRHVVVHERRRGLNELVAIDLANTRVRHTVPLPNDGLCELAIGSNADVAATRFRFACSAPLEPERTFEYNLVDRSITTLHARAPVTAAVSSACRTVRVDSPGGVPVTVTARTEHLRALTQQPPPAQPPPILVHAYGSYGVCASIEYRDDWVPLLARGWAIVTAHVRGGGELGPAWHSAARGVNKVRSFEDLEEVCDWLVRTGFASRERLFGFGASAGGLLFAATANRRPDLFAAIALEAPFLDVLGASMDKTLPLTEHEYDEWGNPADPAVRRALRAYSPYQNMSSALRDRPAVIAHAALNDKRVPYWHALRYITRLRRLRRHGGAPALLDLSTDGGHFGDESARLERRALQYAFMAHAANVVV